MPRMGTSQITSNDLADSDHFIRILVAVVWDPSAMDLSSSVASFFFFFVANGVASKVAIARPNWAEYRLSFAMVV